MDDIEQRFPWECQTRAHYSEVEPWCVDQFGPFDHRWYRYGSDIAGGLGGYSKDIYRFKDEQAAVLFQLRWGG